MIPVVSVTGWERPSSGGLAAPAGIASLVVRAICQVLDTSNNHSSPFFDTHSEWPGWIVHFRITHRHTDTDGDGLPRSGTLQLLKSTLESGPPDPAQCHSGGPLAFRGRRRPTWDC